MGRSQLSSALEEQTVLLSSLRLQEARRTGSCKDPQNHEAENTGKDSKSDRRETRIFSINTGLQRWESWMRLFRINDSSRSWKQSARQRKRWRNLGKSAKAASPLVQNPLSAHPYGCFWALQELVCARYIAPTVGEKDVSSSTDGTRLPSTGVAPPNVNLVKTSAVLQYVRQQNNNSSPSGARVVQGK